MAEQVFRLNDFAGRRGKLSRDEGFWREIVDAADVVERAMASVARRSWVRTRRFGRSFWPRHSAARRGSRGDLSRPPELTAAAVIAGATA